jgi:hypothetical protein
VLYFEKLKYFKVDMIKVTLWNTRKP